MPVVKEAELAEMDVPASKAVLVLADGGGSATTAVFVRGAATQAVDGGGATVGVAAGRV